VFPVRIPNYSRVPHLVNRVSYISDRRIEKREVRRRGGGREPPLFVATRSSNYLFLEDACARVREMTKRFLFRRRT